MAFDRGGPAEALKSASESIDGVVLVSGRLSITTWIEHEISLSDPFSFRSGLRMPDSGKSTSTKDHCIASHSFTSVRNQASTPSSTRSPRSSLPDSRDEKCNFGAWKCRSVKWEYHRRELNDLLATGHLQPSAEMGLAVLPDFSMTIRNFPGIHVVALTGELDAASSDGLADALVQAGGSTVVVDLSGLTFMDSSGIGSLAVARKRIMAEGLGQLVLGRPSAAVGRVLDIVGLSEWVVEWSPDWDE